MFKKNTLYFMLMSPKYFNDFAGIDEFQEDSSRGHGVMLIDVNSLLVAIPLRSKLKPYMANSPHVFPYETYTSSIDNKEYLKALDFSKMTIIEASHVDTTTTYIFRDAAEKQFYLDNFARLYIRASNYIKTYCRICDDISNGKTLKRRTLQPYRFSTLRNFHTDLGISITREQIKQLLSDTF